MASSNYSCGATKASWRVPRLVPPCGMCACLNLWERPSFNPQLPDLRISFAPFASFFPLMLTPYLLKSAVLLAQIASLPNCDVRDGPGHLADHVYSFDNLFLPRVHISCGTSLYDRLSSQQEMTEWEVPSPVIVAVECNTPSDAPMRMHACFLEIEACSQRMSLVKDRFRLYFPGTKQNVPFACSFGLSSFVRSHIN